MPELPEVETMCRGIGGTVGATIETADRPPCSRRPIVIEPKIEEFARRVGGRKVASIGRRGKRVLIHLDDAQVIVIEPRMTGLVLVAAPPTREHLRLRLVMSRGHEILFWDRRGLGTVRLLHSDEFADRIDARLGPDALEASADHFRSALGRSRRTVKVALLDQSVVAGIGNLYAAEILFLAGVDPRTRCDKLSRPQWRRIASSTRIVLEQAIRHEGSTLGDGTYRNALNDPGGYQNHHRVYDRSGHGCPRCEIGEIRRIVQGQRSTFFCPVCQQRSGRHRSVEAR